MIKQLIKSVTPGPIWRLLSTWLHFFAEKREAARHRRLLYKWKRELQSAEINPKVQTSFDISALSNRLPNSGGLPIEVKEIDLKKVFETSFTNIKARRVAMPGFEGLALDDALVWIEDYRHYSFVPLARAISEIAQSHFQHAGFTVLELGCGWGGLRVLLQAYGAVGYLGIDANPLPFSYSPFMRDAKDHYRLLNLQQKIDFAHKFDVVCSFEVLEHIREDTLDNILETIAVHLGQESLFIGTAAMTDYTDVHITVKPRDWWLDSFARHGIVPVPMAQEKTWLPLLARNHPFNWTPTTTSIFVLRKVEGWMS